MSQTGYILQRLKATILTIGGPAGMLALLAVMSIAAGTLLDIRWLTAFGAGALGLTLLAVISRQRSAWRRISAIAAATTTGTVPSHAGIAASPPAPAPTNNSEAQTLAAIAMIEGRDTNSSTMATIVVPVFNEERFLADCLQSLIDQSWHGWRCIVVDDASTDSSLTIARDYAARDSRFSVVRHYENSGLSASRNTGLRLVETPWVAFLDSDDLLLVDNLKDRLTTAAAIVDPAVAGIFGGVQQYPEEVVRTDLPPHLPWASPPFHDYLSSRGECPFNAHAPLLRTEIVRTFGGFDEQMLQGAEDWKLWLRIMRAGYYFLPASYTTAIYRQKRRSMVRSMPAGHLEEAERLLSWIHVPLDQDTAVRSGPSPFLEPISVYDGRLALTKRVIGYLGLASLAEDPAEFLAAVAKLPASLPLGWERHIEVDRILDDSYRRALAVDRATYANLRPRLEPQMAKARHALEGRVTGVAPEARSDTPGVVFLPVNAAQAIEMAEIAQSLDLPYRFVTTDRWTGNQGVKEVLATRGVTSESLHVYYSRSAPSTAIVLGSPTTALAHRFAAAMATQGLPVFTLDSSIDQLDDAPEVVGKLIDAAALPELLSSIGESHPFEGPVDVWQSINVIAYTEEAGTAGDAESIRRFRNRHAGERVFIIGNGPSLNDLDLSKMAGENTIAVNGIFYAKDDMGFDPTYYVVEDTSVMRENREAILEYEAGHKFFPTIYRPLVPEGDDVTFFQMNRGFYAAESPHFCVPRFSVDASSTMFSGQSVTIINLQLAYYLGFATAILIGMDFSYSIPASGERSGDIIRSIEDDPNHFHPDYFGKGKTWKDPKLDRVLANYQLAKLIYEADGRRIINATAGGKLELFERVQYDSLFGLRPS